MLKRERQAYILHQVNLHNKVLSTDLSQQINVSDDTIRRDLQELAEAKKLIKVHGGALSNSFGLSDYSARQIYSVREKKIIAEKAATLIKDGMFVITGGGTTIIELARHLPPELHATFISGSIPAVLEYMHHPNIDVITIGGKVSKSSKITAGVDAIDQLRHLKADLCILGVNALDLQNGVSDNDWDVVQLKKAMIDASQRLICLTISEKINTVQPIQVCDSHRIDTLITDLPASDPRLQPYREAGIKIL
ncbi:MAG: DeoR/GlpR family DNA-binding transcription regulator [Flavisolibacter sp.]